MPKYRIMRLTKPIPYLQDDAPKTIYVRETTEHPCSHYGQPVTVDREGDVWDGLSLASYSDTGRTRYFAD